MQPSSAPEDTGVKVTANPARLLRLVLWLCLGCEVALLLLDALVARTGILGYPPLAEIFDLTGESGLGNFFSSVQALGVGLVLWLIRCRVKLEGPAARWRRRAWGALALFFVYLGIDDGAMIHERLGSYATYLGGASSWFHGLATWFGSYSWQLVIGPVFALAGVLMAVFLWRELRGDGRRFVALAFVCYAVAVGLDYLEGKPGSYVPVVAFFHLHIDTVQHYAKVVEELTEMFGTTLFLIGFLGHLLALTPRLELTLVAKEPK